MHRILRGSAVDLSMIDRGEKKINELVSLASRATSLPCRSYAAVNAQIPGLTDSRSDRHEVSCRPGNLNNLEETSTYSTVPHECHTAEYDVTPPPAFLSLKL